MYSYAKKGRAFSPKDWSFISSYIFGIILVYIWGLMLALVGGQFYFFAAFALVAFSVCSVPGKRDLLYNMKTGAAFGLVVGIIDLISMAIFSPAGLGIAALDIPIKIIVGLIAGLIYTFFARKFESKRKLAAGTTGLLSRRIVSGVMDLNIILFLIFIASLIANPFTALGSTNLYFIIFIEILIMYLYKSLAEAWKSQSIGKMVAGLKVKGGPVQAFIRNLNIVLFGITMLPEVFNSPAIHIIYLIVLIDLIMLILGRRLFDVVASTKVEPLKLV